MCYCAMEFWQMSVFGVHLIISVGDGKVHVLSSACAIYSGPTDGAPLELALTYESLQQCHP